MRRAPALAMALSCGAAGAAGAQSLAPDPASRALAEAAFAAGPVRWTSGQVALGERGGGAVDSLRVSVGDVLVTPGGLPLDLARGQLDAAVYEISMIRDWPGAVRLETQEFDIDLSPHAGVGLGAAGGSAEAGARLELSHRRDDMAVESLRDLGVGDGAAFGGQGRWYLFAAASGRAVGLNMLRDGRDWDRAGWTTDPTSALIGDAQIGVGWRKGPLQSAFGFIHREVKGEHMIFGQKTRDDSLMAFSFSLKSHN